MRFRSFRVAALAFTLIATLGATAHARPGRKSCAQQIDCKVQGEYCSAGTCKALQPGESFLAVALERAAPAPAYLYVDGAMMGQLPWEGIVAPGTHAMRVECQGMTPVEFQGTSLSGAVDYVPIRLTPLPPPAYGAGPTGNMASTADGSGGRGTPGTLRLALGVGFGYGTAIGYPDWRRPVITLLGGGSFGLRVLTKPVWLEVGLAAASTTLRIKQYKMDTDGDGDIDRFMRWGDFFKLDLGLLFRVMFPVKENLLYLGAEFSPGAGISNHNYVYGDLAFSISIFPHELFEIFVNPAGIDYAQELATKNASFMVSYRATLGIALRFPKKPLF